MGYLRAGMKTGLGVVAVVAAYSALPQPAGGQEGQADLSALGDYHTAWGIPGSPTGRRLGHLLEAMRLQDEAFTRAFVAAAFDATFRDQFPMDAHIGVLHSTGASLGNFEVTRVERLPGGAASALLSGAGAAVELSLAVAEAEPHLITSLNLASAGGQEDAGEQGDAGDPDPGCSDRAPYDALDFWIGDWTVSAAGERQGTNRIERVLEGCAVLEHWTDVLGGTGKSLFYVDPVTEVWKQVWVTDHAFDPAGGILEKSLVPADSEGLVFQGTIGGNPQALSRTTLTPSSDGNVRQLIQRSQDGGTTWATTFDAIYEPIGAAAGDDHSPLGRARAVADRWGEEGLVGQVWVVDEGRPVFEAGYGTIAGGDTTAVDMETVFAIGSITKQFTRVAILALVEDGLFQRSDLLGDLLPNVPEDKADVTVEQLLLMRAGFHEYHDDDGDHQPMTKDEALRRILAQPLLFDPGSERAYSNSGYTLLAAIVEEVSGHSFSDFVRNRLLDPLGLDRIGFHGEPRWADEDVARGRSDLQVGNNAPNTWPSPTWVLQGAGGMVASAADLSRWILALRGGEVLGPSLLEHAYGSGETALYAGGDDYGFNCGVIELNGGRTHVIVMTASGSSSIRIANEVLEAYTGRTSPVGVPGG